MASGILGRAALAATTNTTVYTVPAATLATVNASLCNRSASPVTVRLAVATGGAPADQDWIEYDLSLPAHTAFERTGLVLGAGTYLVAYASAAAVSAQVWGYEEGA